MLSSTTAPEVKKSAERSGKPVQPLPRVQARVTLLLTFFCAIFLGGPLFHVSAQANPQALKAPFCIRGYFFPSGWMGDIERIKLNEEWRENCRSASCIKVTYQPGARGWAGVYWQYPDGNWGDERGRKIEGANKLVFWARGQHGDEIVRFKTGGINQRKSQDSFEKVLGPVRLTREWKQYQIEFNGMDTSSVIGAFAWVASADGNPGGLTFFLDDICFQQ
jgi:hypothetical protein